MTMTHNYTGDIERVRDMQFLIANAFGDALAVIAYYLGRRLIRCIKDKRRDCKIKMQLLEEMYHERRQKDIVSDCEEIPL